MGKVISLVSLFVTILGIGLLQATSIIPAKNMGQMIDFSEEVVYSTCSDIKEVKSENGNIYVEYSFTVISNIKGELSPRSTYSTRSISYRRDDGYFFKVEDEGSYQLGHNYVMPLKALKNSYGETMLSYGVLEEIKVKGISYLVRTQESYAYGLISLDDEPIQDYGPYLVSDFVSYASKYVAQPQPWNEKAIRVANLHISSLNREAPSHCTNLFSSGPYPVRWENPAQALPVYEANTLSNKTNIATIFSNSIGTITNQFGVNMTNGGTTTQSVSCNGAGEEVVDPQYLRAVTIIYADPCDNIADLSGCTGILGLGGVAGFGTHDYDGQTWYSAAAGQLIVNNGVECLSDRNYEIFMTHELGHTIGLGHIANADGVALMNPYCCNDVTSLDIECADYMYATVLPVDFKSFSVSAKDGISEINWQVTNEYDVENYTVEYSGDGVHFETIEAIKPLNVKGETGNYVAYHRPSVQANVHYYRVTQHSLDGTESGTEIVKIESQDIFSESLINYSQGVLTVFADFIDHQATLNVSAITGKQVYSEDFTSENPYLQSSLVDLPAGIYIVSVQSGDSRFTKKIFID